MITVNFILFFVSFSLQAMQIEEKQNYFDWLPNEQVLPIFEYVAPNRFAVKSLKRTCCRFDAIYSLLKIKEYIDPGCVFGKKIIAIEKPKQKYIVSLEDGLQFSISRKRKLKVIKPSKSLPINVLIVEEGLYNLVQNAKRLYDIKQSILTHAKENPVGSVYFATLDDNSCLAVWNRFCTNKCWIIETGEHAKQRAAFLNMTDSLYQQKLEKAAIDNSHVIENAYKLQEKNKDKNQSSLGEINDWCYRIPGRCYQDTYPTQDPTDDPEEMLKRFRKFLDKKSNDALDPKSTYQIIKVAEFKCKRAWNL